jgi:glucose-1-phosphate thymidylyltransferase
MIKKAVVLAAGEGKRLRPFTETMPKVMLPISNKPMLEYVFEAVKNSGIEEIIVIVGYKKEVIMEYFKDYSLKYVFQDKQLGTAHALLQARNLIHEDFIVLSGDNIIDRGSISKLISDKSRYSMLIKKNPYPSKYGVVFVERNTLLNIVEKPEEETSRFISTGIYKLPCSIFGDIEKLTSQGIHDFTSVVQSIIKRGEKVKTIVADQWMDIVYPWDLINVNEAMTSKITFSTSGVIEKGVTLKGPVYIGRDSTIYSGCYLVGPVVIGSGCEIGPNTCIFPCTTIGNNSVVRPFCEIRNSVIMDDTQIGSSSCITHSIIARGNIIGSNFSNIPGRATLEIEGEFKKVDNIGAIIGEDCTIGNNVIIEPGIIIGRRCRIASMKRISKNLPSMSKVI